MALEPEAGDSVQARRAWMIEEFQEAQRRRRALALVGAVDRLPPSKVTNDAPVGTDPADALIVGS